MPAKLSDIERALKKFGVALRKPKKGSHFRATADGKGMYPLTGHNGLKSDIPDVYVKGLCRNFDIDYDEFKKLL